MRISILILLLLCACVTARETRGPWAENLAYDREREAQAAKQYLDECA